jgi:hypothetical protein
VEKLSRGNRRMPILGFQIQTILKTYHKNVWWTKKKPAGGEDQSHDRDRVETSVEGRKKRIRQKAANNVIERLTRPRNTTVPLPKDSQ